MCRCCARRRLIALPWPDATITASLGGEAFAGSAQARLLVVADGAGSRLRAALGVAAQTRSYEQTAIVGTVEVAQPGDGVTAFERFTPQGPMAMLPAGDGRYVFVLTAGEDAVAETLALDDSAFRDLLQARFGFRLGRIGRVGQRGSYPLALTCAQQLKTTRAAIVGNAAHGLHPVAGQGYNLGLRDAATLAELLADDLRSGEPDPGSDALLAEYAAWREQDQRNVVAFTDGLVRGFELPARSSAACAVLGWPPLMCCRVPRRSWRKPPWVWAVARHAWPAACPYDSATGDFLVLGGGLVGLAFANLLAARLPGVAERIVVVDRAAPAPVTGDVGLRVSAWSAASTALLNEAGAWQQVPAARQGPYRRMVVWRESGPEGRDSIHFDAAEQGLPALGHIVENDLLRALLWEQASQAGVRFEVGARPRRLQQDDSGVRA